MDRCKKCGVVHSKRFCPSCGWSNQDKRYKEEVLGGRQR